MRQHARAEPVAVHALGIGCCRQRHVLIQLWLAEDAVRGSDRGAQHELDGARVLAGDPAHPGHPHIQITRRLGAYREGMLIGVLVHKCVERCIGRCILRGCVGRRVGTDTVGEEKLLLTWESAPQTNPPSKLGSHGVMVRFCSRGFTPLPVQARLLRSSLGAMLGYRPT